MTDEINKAAECQTDFRESTDDHGFLNVCSAKNNGSSVIDLNSCDKPLSSDNFLCLQSKQYFDSLEIPISRCKKKTVQELNKYSLKQLQVLVEDLTHAVEEVSSELVQLLLENDALQQESDARNIAIEQLLKMTVKVNDSELKPIQMSVILPDGDRDDAV